LKDKNIKTQVIDVPLETRELAVKIISQWVDMCCTKKQGIRFRCIYRCGKSNIFGKHTGEN
jgi:repressor of nif and glnA expression